MTGACGQDTASPLFIPYPSFFSIFFFISMAMEMKEKNEKKGDRV
jgi:hypothetical protein